MPGWLGHLSPELWYLLPPFLPLPLNRGPPTRRPPEPVADGSPSPSGHVGALGTYGQGVGAGLAACPPARVTVSLARGLVGAQPPAVTLSAAPTWDPLDPRHPEALPPLHPGWREPPSLVPVPTPMSLQPHPHPCPSAPGTFGAGGRGEWSAACCPHTASPPPVRPAPCRGGSGRPGRQGEPPAVLLVCTCTPPGLLPGWWW